MTTTAATTDLTAEQALAAVHTDRPAQSEYLHCFRGAIGADWRMPAAKNIIRTAVRRWWVHHPFRHDLAVQTTDGIVYHLDVRRPDDVQPPEPADDEPAPQPPAPGTLNPALYPVMDAVQTALASAVPETADGRPGSYRPLLHGVQPRDRRRLAALAVQVAARMVADDLAAKCLALGDRLDGTQPATAAQQAGLAGAALLCREYARPTRNDTAGVGCPQLIPTWAMRQGQPGEPMRCGRPVPDGATRCESCGPA
jgi:hypothetical protein